jgi:(p)ppGpp synthase/HD superfamily hydrolase
LRHPRKVCADRTAEHGGSEEQAIAALLHDAVEDQGGVAALEKIRSLFGDGATQIIADCTDAWTEPKPEWRVRKEAYLKELPYKPPASLLVSLADKTHNAEAILFDYQELGPALWDRFNGGATARAGTTVSLLAVLRRSRLALVRASEQGCASVLDLLSNSKNFRVGGHGQIGRGHAPCSRKRRPRHWGHSGLARPSIDSAYGAYTELAPTRFKDFWRD